MEEGDGNKKIAKTSIPQTDEEDTNSDDCYEITPIYFTQKLKSSSSKDNNCYEIAPIEFTQKLKRRSSKDDNCYEIAPIEFTQKLKSRSSKDDNCYEIAPIEFTQKLKSSSSKLKSSSSEHDSCYEIAPIDFTQKFKSSSSEDDSVTILGVKGDVALRDFPHPRHLCGNFPFSRTEHETYCSKCFCYVCEVAAPCSEWFGQNGHCHVSRKKFHVAGIS